MTTSVTRKRSLDQRLLHEARIARGTLVSSLISNALTGIVVVVQALLLGQVIHRVFLLQAGLGDVSPLLMALLVVVGLRAVLSYWSGTASARLATTVKHRLQERYIAQLYELGPAFTRVERSGDLVLSATEGIEKLDGYYRDYLPGLFTALFVPILILVVVLPLDALTFVVLLVTAPLIPFFMALIGMAAGALARGQFLEMRHLGAHFLDVMQGLITLKLFNRSQYQAETIQRITGQFRKATMHVLQVAFLSAFTLEMLATLSVAIVAVEIGVRLLHGGIGFEQALFLLVIAPEFYLPLRALGAKFHSATESKSAAERLFEVLDMTAPTPLPTETQAVPNHLHIRFDNVMAAYEQGARPALNGVSFDIKPGEHVALVGASGSGKTTIVHLLLRFVEADSGRITLDDQDLKLIPVEVWREQIAWVSQSPYLFNTTIAENICFGHPDASFEAITAAARAAGAHEFITQLPDGYQTLCGERGMRLSGGQAQRIALARALLKDARLLILDEPTSQLDPQNEAEIMQVLALRKPGRSVLLVTHRLDTAVQADKVVVLADGVVVEQGSHTDLMAVDRAYARLVKHDGNVDDAS